MIQYMICEDGKRFIATFVYNGQKEVQSFEHSHLAWEWIQKKLRAELIIGVTYQVNEVDAS